MKYAMSSTIGLHLLRMFMEHKHLYLVELERNLEMEIYLVGFLKKEMKDKIIKNPFFYCIMENK